MHRVRALVLGDLERHVDARIEALLAAPGEAPGDPYRAAAQVRAMDFSTGAPPGGAPARAPRPAVKGF